MFSYGSGPDEIPSMRIYQESVFFLFLFLFLSYFFIPFISFQFA